MDQIVSKKHILASLPWVLTILVSGLAIFVWASSLAWHFGGLSIYQIFPVLGLLAFSIMWSHYVAGFMHSTFLKDVELDRYFSWTGYAVLVAILLHPGLLAYQRFQDGFGLPPGSETSYVAHGMAWIVVLGIVSLFVLLAFELHRWFSQKRWWFIIPKLGDAAMLAIFYHALQLGTQTHIAWYRKVWWFYGACLVIVLIYSYVTAFRKKNLVQ